MNIPDRKPGQTWLDVIDVNELAAWHDRNAQAAQNRLDRNRDEILADSIGPAVVRLTERGIREERDMAWLLRNDPTEYPWDRFEA
jgi:hypothetical protein